MAWRAAAAIVLLAAAALRPSSAPAVAERSPPIVTYRSDQLSVRLEKVALEDVLTELGRVSGAEIQGAPRELRDITAQFDDVPHRQRSKHAAKFGGEPGGGCVGEGKSRR